MVAAIILAAGRSSRMGRAKALLPHPAGTTFVNHLVRQAQLSHLEPVLVVGRADDTLLSEEAKRSGATYVTNPDADLGQLSSIISGIHAVQGDATIDAIVLMPVDVPMVSSGTLDRLVQAATGSPAPIVRSVAGERHGHPVLFKRAMFAELLRADPAVGARAVVRADPRRVLDVEMGDLAVTIDVDTPADYEQLWSRRRG